jgi:hypothetical protein
MTTTNEELSITGVRSRSPVPEEAGPVPVAGGPARWHVRGPASPIAGGWPASTVAGPSAAVPAEETLLRDTENKPLTAISNRNSNERRKRATLPTSIISKFLIATKMHLSEEKAKRE